MALDSHSPEAGLALDSVGPEAGLALDSVGPEVRGTQIRVALRLACARIRMALRPGWGFGSQSAAERKCAIPGGMTHQYRNHIIVFQKR